MTSGFRLTVALVLVALIAIGFYFANLEGGDRPEEASITRDPAVIVDEPNEPLPIAKPGSSPENTKDPSGFDLVDASSPVESAGIEETSDPPTLVEDVPAPAEPLEIENDAEMVAVDPKIDRDVATDPAIESIVETAVESTPDPVVPAYGRSQGVRASGIYLLEAISPEDALIDAETARSKLAASIDPRPAGPEGTAWVPISAWCSVVGDGALQGIVIGSRMDPKGERQFLLVRDDELRGLRLDGRVSEADAFENNEGRPRVAFLLESDAVDEVREASFAMVGGTVAWIVDGEVVAMPPLEVAIQNRGRINGRFDLEHARWIAARLRGELMRRPGEPDPAEDDDEDEDRGSSEAGDGRVRSAAELPASAYTSYKIQAGDNFESIAIDWFGDARKQSLIAIANPTVDPIRLQIGQVIKLPPKDTPLAIQRSEPTETGVIIHVVQSGETLSDIAVEYLGKASRWRDIHEANLDVIGEDPARLRVGMELRIP